MGIHHLHTHPDVLEERKETAHLLGAILHPICQEQSSLGNNCCKEEVKGDGETRFLLFSFQHF